MRVQELKPADLSVDAVYVTPSGRLCRLKPRARKGNDPLPVDTASFGFEYLDGAGRYTEAESFSLTPPNVRFLRKASNGGLR